MAYKLQSLTATGWSDAFPLEGHAMDLTANTFPQEGPAIRLCSTLHDLWPSASFRVIRSDDD